MRAAWQLNKAWNNMFINFWITTSEAIWKSTQVYITLLKDMGSIEFDFCKFNILHFLYHIQAKTMHLYELN